MLAFVNQQFIEEENAVLQVGDLALQRGYGAFDFLRTHNNAPLFLDDYVDRFFRSAVLMHLHPAQSKEELKAIIQTLIKKNNVPQSGIRMVLTGGYSPDSFSPAGANLVVLQGELRIPTTEMFMAGVKVISHDYQREIPEAKSINYLMGIWLQPQIKLHEASDVLYHRDGWVSELPRANVFMVDKDRKIITPTNHILKGITRSKLLHLIKDEYHVEIRNIHLDELKNATEVFMTSTTKRILPISRVDDTLIGDGKAGAVAIALRDAFIEMENKLLVRPKTA